MIDDLWIINYIKERDAASDSVWLSQRNREEFSLQEERRRKIRAQMNERNLDQSEKFISHDMDVKTRVRPIVKSMRAFRQYAHLLCAPYFSLILPSHFSLLFFVLSIQSTHWLPRPDATMNFFDLNCN